MIPTTDSKRVKAVDSLRGATVAGMILVNNPGSWGHMYAPLRHAVWNGLTPTDLIFPFFLFIMGMSMYISLSKCAFAPTRQLHIKILRRSVLLILIGWGVGLLSHFLRMWYALGESGEIGFWSRLGQSLWAFPTMRILGVFPRLGITYGVAAFLLLHLDMRRIVQVIWVSLLLYAVLLLSGNGYEYGEANVISRIDRMILTPPHMYLDNGIEPEGLVSTLPATMQVLVGALMGRVLLERRGEERLNRLFVTGTVLLLLGYVLSWWLPVNKKIWSPTFVLVTCGISLVLLALLIYYIDHRGKERLFGFFTPFGVNPLFTYLASTVLALLFIRVRIPLGPDEYTTVTAAGYRSLLSLVRIPELASFLYSLCFLLINWAIGYLLHKKKIYIKL